MTPLSRGVALPLFSVTTISGSRVDYGEVWQRRVLVLLALAGDSALDAYAAELIRRLAAEAPDAACVVTRDNVPGVRAPSLIVADQWGEIDTVHVIDASRPPTIDEVVATLEHIRTRCPECEGEAL